MDGIDKQDQHAGRFPDAAAGVWREADRTHQPDTPAMQASAPASAVGDVGTLRVLLMPDATAGNPYQRLLTGALERLGVRVCLTRPDGALPLLAAVRRHGPVDVLHLHWTHRLVIGRTRLHTVVKGARFLAELAMLRLRGVRVVWTAHNLIEHERRHPWLELMYSRLAARLYHRIIVHCDAARSRVLSAYRLSGPRRAGITVIAHGHFIGAYPHGIGRDEARERLQLADAGPVFVHFGQIRGYKGLDELLAAFARLPQPSARLVIAGRPWSEAMAAELEASARRDTRIRLVLRFIPDTQVQVFMNAADAVVLPYRDVLTSGSAMLAMSFGRAVIMPRCGCAEAMFDGRGALLYDPRQPRALERALRAAGDADLAAMGACNRRHARTFDWDAIASRTEAVYRGRRAS